MEEGRQAGRQERRDGGREGEREGERGGARERVCCGRERDLLDGCAGHAVDSVGNSMPLWVRKEGRAAERRGRKGTGTGGVVEGEEGDGRGGILVSTWSNVVMKATNSNWNTSAKCYHTAAAKILGGIGGGASPHMHTAHDTKLQYARAHTHT